MYIDDFLIKSDYKYNVKVCIFNIFAVGMEKGGFIILYSLWKEANLMGNWFLFEVLDI
ncbi:hypothetical protein C621_0216460 [Bacillus thuringiensis serovar aizawai str. Leapi01]|nr:hypothetical protein C621_0216460 [Bacillus thuringiensis serovar aizawai str. Leapi01]ETE96172.1 hypothetical protein C623_0220595 [Bacillus thuringiensis serovar aizawai str. Hu4-2]